MVLDSASLNELLAATEPERQSNMVALNDLTRPARSDNVTSLLSKVTDRTDSHTAQHRDQHWDGRRETLGGWFKEFATTLSTLSHELYEFAVDAFVSDRNKTVIFVPGQAALLDGAVTRPDFSWDNPAPSDKSAYDVPDEIVADAYAEIHRQRLLRDPTLDPTPPNVPPGTSYPVDKDKYSISLAQFRSWDLRLRNAILRFVADLPRRHMLAEMYERSGRDLLDHLRTLSKSSMSTTQVKSILADIDALIESGIKEDTVASFNEVGVLYHRLLNRIPDGNASKDSPAMQATRYMTAVINSRPDIGQSLMHHFSSRSINQDDPGAVRESIYEFLEEQASVQRMCKKKTARPPVPTLPDVNGLPPISLANQSLVNTATDPRKFPSKVKPNDRTQPTRRARWDADKNEPCHHCGGNHFTGDCTDKLAGTRTYVKEALKSSKAHAHMINTAFAGITKAYAGDF